MATSREYIEYIQEQLQGLDDILIRPMMGEYLIYFQGKVIADVCDNRLLIKPTKAALSFFECPILEPPYEGAKDYVLIENTENREMLEELFNRVVYELPEPKPKKIKRKEK